MALKQFNPTSPGRRGLVLVDKSELHKGRPVKALVEGLTKYFYPEASNTVVFVLMVLVLLVKPTGLTGRAN